MQGILWGKNQSGRGMRNVYLVQVNNRFGDNVFLPYSLGLIQAYCQSLDWVNREYCFKELIYLRERPDAIVERMDHPDVVGFSCYIWNWEFNKVLAKKVRESYPECLIVFGGPHVPKSVVLRSDIPDYVDVVVNHEGEVAFSEILRTRCSGVSVYTQTPQIPSRIDDLSILPSPYLTGVFDKLLADNYNHHASQETHRGCVYSCSFCDWGSAVLTKIRAFDEERLIREFEWMGQHEIELLYNADANFGLLGRDLDLTKAMVATKEKYGYPQQFRAAYAKNSNQKVLEISRVVHQAGMSKGTTLSFQSLDAHTLQEIKRSNIKIENFKLLLGMYRQEGIPTYTELILGLPGETYDSFTKGIEQLLNAGQHEGLNIYLLAVLPNAEMGDPEYQTKHGMRVIRSPLLQQHSTPNQDGIHETCLLCIETATMPEADWVRAYMFSWAVQTFHGFGLLREVAMYLHDVQGVSYREFYEWVLQIAARYLGTDLAGEYRRTLAVVTRGLAGGSWGEVYPRYGFVTWPTEELSYLNIASQRANNFHDDKFYTEMNFLLRLKWPDLREVSSRIVLDHASVRAVSEFDGDLVEFAKQAVWYARKRLLQKPVEA